MDNYNYPVGADTSEAPWNKEEKPEKEVEVIVSITMSKTVKVKVSDYKITDSGVDEDGEPYEDIDYSECDLREAVENQIYLPYESGQLIDNLVGRDKAKDIIIDLSNWNIDEMEVIPE